MSLQEFIRKNKEQLGAELRCGSCGNSLQQCGKYTIEKVGLGKGKRSEEGILCETCGKAGRKLTRVTRIIESPQTAVKQVAQFRIADIDPKIQEEEENIIEQFKKKEIESITEKQPTQVIINNEKALTKQDNKDKKED